MDQVKQKSIFVKMSKTSVLYFLMCSFRNLYTVFLFVFCLTCNTNRQAVTTTTHRGTYLSDILFGSDVNMMYQGFRIGSNSNWFIY